MKKTLRRSLAALLSLSLLLSVSALAAPAYGEELTARSVTLHDGVELYRQAHWSSYYTDLRQETYVTYAPGDSVSPAAVFGGAVTSKTTVSSAAQALEQEGKRVVFGVNGDYFDANGTPIGLLVSGGSLLSSDGGNYAIGFDEDGNAVIGAPRLTITGSINGGEAFSIAALNKARSSSGGIYAYTYDFNATHTTGTAESGVDVVLAPLTLEEVHTILENEALAAKAEEEGVTVEELTNSQRRAALRSLELPDELTSPSIGGRSWYKVVRVVENGTTAATPVAQGELALSVNAKAGEAQLAILRAMQPDDVFSLSITANDPRWNDVTEAVGGLYLLVENGQARTGLGTDNAPRTAVGVKENGEVVLYTVDGRRSGYSVGSSLNTLAQRMAELGCVTAICLDGGGSTTAIASMPDSETISILNRPSDNAERKVSNLLLLVSEDEPNNRPGRIYLDTDTPYVLSGGTAQLRAALVDQNHFPMDDELTIRASDGSVSGTTFTAPEGSGTVTITATARGKRAELDITIVESPEELRLYQSGTRLTALTIQPGESVDLSASAYYRHLPLTTTDEDFCWTVSGNIGSVDASGVFTSAQRSGSGTLTLSKGSASLTIPVTVTTKPLITLEDFEGSSTMDSGYNTTVSALEGGDMVRYDNYSMSVSYTGVDAGGAAATLNLTQPAGYDRLNVSVYGDGSGNVLSLYDSEGNSTALATLDFTGWKQLSTPLAPGTRITAVTITGATPSGTICFDQFVASYGDIIDADAPVITGTLENGILTAAAADDIDGALPRTRLSLLCDGNAVPASSYTLSGGTLTADLTALLADGLSHRVTLKAQDASGNRARMSWDIAASTESAMPFVDCTYPSGEPHWAAANIQYFYDQNLLTGFEINGQYYARPDQNMTRAEFAVLLFRYLGLKAEDYQSVEVPFDDLSRIDAWALDAAKAMYSLGIIKGNGTTDGKLYFSPNDTITRAQAVTILGRLQEKGYASAELTGFTDASSVPDWAAAYFKTMVAQGVISGSDGKLSPNASMTRAQALKVLSLMR